MENQRYRFHVYFTGKHVNALGVPEKFEVNVFAESCDDMLLKLYQDYEHITIHSFFRYNEGKL